MDQERVTCPYCHPPYKEIKTEFDDDSAYIRAVHVTQITPLPAINLTTGEKDSFADPPFHELMIVRKWVDEPWREEDGLVIQFCPWCGRKLDEAN